MRSITQENYTLNKGGSLFTGRVSTTFVLDCRFGCVRNL